MSIHTANCTQIVIKAIKLHDAISLATCVAKFVSRTRHVSCCGLGMPLAMIF